jgi:hypothetical protein
MFTSDKAALGRMTHLWSDERDELLALVDQDDQVPEM